MPNNTAAMWSAVAASFAALSSFLIMLIHRQDLLESARPELVLSGWSRKPQGQSGGVHQVISFQPSLILFGSHFLGEVWVRASTFRPRAAGIATSGQPMTPRATSSTPATTSATPASRPTRSPRGTTFSTRTATAMAATQRRFMTPATNRSAISAQQHPRQ
jgi:hypothetical protein